MHSPPMEWVLDGAYFIAKDILRARGEADGDTLSEVVRDHMNRIPHGDALFTAFLVLGAYALRHHIVRPKETP